MSVPPWPAGSFFIFEVVTDVENGINDVEDQPDYRNSHKNDGVIAIIVIDLLQDLH